jgi:uncharacterized membrane protein YoaK (UPF0700 family)
VSSPRRRRDVLLILLAVTTGATDATAFEQLGHAFASVITGNLVLLGVSAASGDGTLALFSGCALAGYAAGVLVAAPGRSEPKHPDHEWPPGATGALTVDLTFLVAFAIGWEVAGAHASRGVQLVLLVLAACAMGAQSTGVRRLGHMSTTYLTSTLTGLVEALRARRWSPEHGRSLAIIAAAIAGAVAATLLIIHARPATPALQLLPLLFVVVTARRVYGTGAASALR